MRKPVLLAAVLLTGAPLVILACSSEGGSVLGPGETPPVSAGSDASSSTPVDATITSQDTGTTATDSGGGDTGADSAVGDAGTDSAALDSGIPSCVGIDYCDDFESYLDAGGDGGVLNGGELGAWKIAVSGKAEMKVDTVRPYSGLRSLHITVPVNDPSSAATLHQTAGAKEDAGLVAGNNVWGRAMVYYDDTGTNNLPQGHSWVFQSTGYSTVEKGDVNMNVANGGTDYFLNYHSVSNPEQSVTGGKPVAGQWLCMQWEYNGSGATPVDEGKIWINNVLVVDSKDQKPNWDFATPWNNFDFGFTHYQEITNSMDVFLDDFALNGAMIPCP